MSEGDENKAVIKPLGPKPTRPVRSPDKYSPAFILLQKSFHVDMISADCLLLEIYRIPANNYK